MGIFTSSKRPFSTSPAAQALYDAAAKARKAWANRPVVRLGQMVRVTAGGRHAIYESNVGQVRKPYQN